MKHYTFTSESVTEGHPDKVADLISDTIADYIIDNNQSHRAAIETLVTTNKVCVSGEYKSSQNVAKDSLEPIIRKTIENIGYDQEGFSYKNVDIDITLDQQSNDIALGTDNFGAGDQGMMFGYATNETENLMPLALDISHKILIELAEIRREGKHMTYLRPDSKSQITLEYNDDHTPKKITDVVVSTQHDDFDNEKNMQTRIEQDVKSILMPRVLSQLTKNNRNLFGEEKYHVNPTGKFVIGGPHGDTGLTGRKIIVDTYGGKGAHGGGAFSGKDPSKVDRSAAYATRHIAKNLVAAGLADRILVQVSYAIGVAEPMGIFVDTYGSSKVNMTDGEIANKIENMECFNLKPASIIKRLKLKKPIYSETAAYGHMGRNPEKKTLNFNVSGVKKSIDIETFTWEKLDCQEEVKKTFGL